MHFLLLTYVVFLSIFLLKGCYRKFYDDERGKCFALDASKVQLCRKDDSKLSGNKTESKKKIDKGSGADRVVEYSGKCLTSNAIEVQLYSGETLKVPSVGKTKISKEPINSVETHVGLAAAKDVKDLDSSSEIKYENFAFKKDEEDENEFSMEERVMSHHEKPIGQNTVLLESGCDEGESHDAEFLAKYILCFAWQIAQGMVRSYLNLVLMHGLILAVTIPPGFFLSVRRSIPHPGTQIFHTGCNQ